MTNKRDRDEEDEPESQDTTQHNDKRARLTESEQIASAIFEQLAQDGGYIDMGAVADRLVEAPSYSTFSSSSPSVREDVALPTVEIERHFGRQPLKEPEFRAAMHNYRESAFSANKNAQQVAREVETIFRCRPLLDASTAIFPPTRATEEKLVTTIRPTIEPPVHPEQTTIGSPVPVYSPVPMPGPVYRDDEDTALVVAKRVEEVDRLGQAMVYMILGVICVLALPCFRAAEPHLAKLLGDHAINKIAWGDFIAVHISLAGVALFALGVGLVVDSLMTPHRYGVIAHAALVVFAVFVANVTFQDFHSRVIPNRGRFYWFVPEIQTRAGLLSLVLSGISLDLLSRNLTGLLQHFAGNGTFYHAIVWAFGGVLYLVSGTHPSLVVQGYAFVLMCLLGLHSALIFLRFRHVVAILLSVAVYQFYPQIAENAPPSLVAHAQSAWSDVKSRVSATGLRL